VISEKKKKKGGKDRDTANNQPGTPPTETKGEHISSLSKAGIQKYKYISRGAGVSSIGDTNFPSGWREGREGKGYSKGLSYSPRKGGERGEGFSELHKVFKLLL